MRDSIRTRHYSRRTEEAYIHWIRRYIVFHGKAHPSTLGASEISAFLTWLAVRQQVSASTQNQALSALLFLHRHVLGMEVGEIGQVPRARVPVRVPVVLSGDEVGAVMTHVTGPLWIIVVLLYGAGLRIQECLELRMRIRHFGLLANRTRRRTVAQCRALLGQLPTEDGPPESGAALLQRLTGVDVSRCPVCGEGRMQITAMVVHEAPPPDTS